MSNLTVLDRAGVVSCLPFSASKTASSLADLVVLALRETACSCPGVSIHISPVAYVFSGSSPTLETISPSST
jgi:hypothetical protein